MEATFIPYGATCTHLVVPDKKGEKRDVILGWDDPINYCAVTGRTQDAAAAEHNGEEEGIPALIYRWLVSWTALVCVLFAGLLAYFCRMRGGGEGRKSEVDGDSGRLSDSNMQFRNYRGARE